MLRCLWTLHLMPSSYNNNNKTRSGSSSCPGFQEQNYEDSSILSVHSTDLFHGNYYCSFQHDCSKLCNTHHPKNLFQGNLLLFLVQRRHSLPLVWCLESVWKLLQAVLALFHYPLRLISKSCTKRRYTALHFCWYLVCLGSSRSPKLGTPLPCICSLLL